MSDDRKAFPMAPMDGFITFLTVFCWLIPIGFLVPIFLDRRAAPIAGVAAFILFLYATVWFWWRPGRFEITDDKLFLKFPTRTKAVRRDAITSCRLIQQKDLKEQFGRTYRVGAGGLWGGFGWLRTSKNSWIEFYISRQSDYVLVERTEEIPLLITPVNPVEFVREMGAHG
jgi:hypothetical protein